MSWARIDERANNNAKLLALTDAAYRLWACALVYCQDNLTDGFVADSAPRTFGVRGSVPKAIDELCAVLVPNKKPLWQKVAGGYQVNDYADWNDPSAVVRKKREQSKQRTQRFRERMVGAERNALHGALHTALPTPLLTQSETRSEHVPRSRSEERTSEYSAEKAGAPRSPVENRLQPSAWTIGLAIAHRVIEDFPDESNNWSHELKARMLNQGIDPNDQGPKRDQGKFFARVLEACIEQRKFRKGDGGVVAWRYRHAERQARKHRRAS